MEAPPTLRIRCSTWEWLIVAFSLLSLSAVAEQAWFQRRLRAVLDDGGLEPVAVLEPHGAGRRVVSRDCRLLRQQEEAWVCGRVDAESSGAYTLRIELRGGADSPEPLTVVLDESFRVAPATYDVILVLDASHSMRKNDPDGLRAEAVKRFCALARRSRRIRRLSLVTFRTEAEQLLAPTHPSEIPDLGRYLRRMTPHGSTDFNPPFKLAAKLHGASAAQRHAVLFLSDGEPRRTYRDAHRLLGERVCPVYTVGLSADADAELLSRIARETGGEFFSAPSAEQLESLFSRIFQLIDRPRRVLSRTLAVRGRASVTFPVDETMHNPLLLCAGAEGTTSASLGGRILYGPSAAGFALDPLVGEAPQTVDLVFTGEGRASCEVLADTDLTLGVVQLNREASVGLPLQLHFYLTDGGRVLSAETVSEVRTPSGATRRLHSDPDAIGMHTVIFDDTRVPGLYRIRLSARGQLANGPFLRERELLFVRKQADTPQAHRLARLQAEVLPSGAPSASDLLRVPRITDAGDSVPELRTTYWASKPRLELPAVPPGDSRSESVDVLVHGPPGVEVRCRLLPLDTTHLACLLSGQVVANRQSVLTVTCVASGQSAGASFETKLVVEAAGKSWQIPVAGAVVVPRIQARLTPVAATESEGYVSGESSVLVSVSPVGTCLVSVATNVPSLKVVPASLIVGQEESEVKLLLSAVSPERPAEWSGNVTVSGPGLSALALPYSFRLEPVAAEPARRAPAAPLTAPAGDGRLPLPRFLIPLLAVLLLLLFAALLAGGRCSRRAAFLAASAGVHALLLCLLLPETSPPARGQEPTGPKTLRISPRPALVEEQVPSERSEPGATEGDPMADAGDKEEAQIVEEREETSNDLEPVDVDQDVSAPEPVEPVGELERPSLDPEALTEAEPVPVRRRSEEELPEARTAQPDTVLEPERHVVREVAEAPRAVAVAAVAQVRPAAEAVEPVAHVARDAIALEARQVTSDDPRQRKVLTVRLTAAIDAEGAASSPVERVVTGTEEATSSLTVGDAQPVAAVAELGAPATSVSRAAMTLADVKETGGPSPVRARRRDSPGEGSAAASGEAEAGTSAPQRAFVEASSGVSNVGRELAPEQLSGVDALPAEATRPALPSRPGTRLEAPVLSAPVPVRRRGRKESAGVVGTDGDAVEAMAAAAGRPASASRPNGSGDAGTVLGVSDVTGGHPVVHPGTAGSSAAPASPGRPGIRLASIDAIGAGRGGESSGRSPRSSTQRSKRLSGGPLPAGQAGRTRVSVGRVAAVGGAGDVEARELDTGGASVALRPSTSGLTVPLAPGPKSSAASRPSGLWQRTFPLLRFAGDWDCDRTAMLNLAHQYERRTGSILPFDSRVVSISDPQLTQAPFVFMSGHTDFRFSAEDADALRTYLQGGGGLWINDSTDVADETFDGAVRREIAKVLPRGEWRRVPLNHGLFTGPYALSGGYRGYRVPPGDKYRVEYLEGIWIGDRLTVVYTRNDYGDGLEIDVHTHPLMASLSDLSPAEMQEASVRMGVNIATHFLRGGAPLDSAAMDKLRGSTDQEDAAAAERWRDAKQIPLAEFAAPAQWQMPDGWAGDHFLDTRAVPLPGAGGAAFGKGLRVEFKPTGRGFKGWYHQAVVGRPCHAPIGKRHVLLMNITSHLSGGCRVAVGFAGAGSGPYVETAPAYVRPGLNQDVVFDLRQPTFKSGTSKWQHTEALPGGFRAQNLYILVYPQQGSGSVELSNVRFVIP